MRKAFVSTILLGGLMTIVALVRFVPMDHASLESLRDWRHSATRDLDPSLLHPEKARAQRLTEVQQKISGQMAHAQEQMQEAIQRGQERASAILAQQRAQVPGLVEQADKKLQGYSNAIGLVRRMAQDKIRGSHETQQYLQEAFLPIAKMEATTQVQLKQVLQDTTAELALITARLQAETLQTADGNGFTVTELGLDECFKRLAEAEAHSLKASMHAGVATLEVAIEGVLIKTTYKALTNLLAKAVSKEIASLAIGAEGAAIPVVDIVTSVIAVGGTAWTAYDVHHAVQEMKKTDPEIRAGVNDALDILEKKTTETFSSLRATSAVLCHAS